MKRAIKRRFNNEPITPQSNTKSDLETNSISPEIFHTPKQVPSLKRKICQTPRRIENIKKMKVKSLFSRDIDYSSESDDALRGVGLTGVREIRDIDSKHKANVAEQISYVEAGFMNCSISKAPCSTPIRKERPSSINKITTTTTAAITTAAATIKTAAAATKTKTIVCATRTKTTATATRTKTTATATTTKTTATATTTKTTATATTTKTTATATTTTTMTKTTTKSYANLNYPCYLYRPNTDEEVDVIGEIIRRPSKIFPMTRAELKRGLRL